MLAVLVIVIVAAAAILLTPIALAEAVTVPVSQIAFSENTSGGALSLGGHCYNSTGDGSVLTCGSASSTTVYEYYFLTRPGGLLRTTEDRKSTRLNSSHTVISYAVFCLKKKKK